MAMPCGMRIATARPFTPSTRDDGFLDPCDANAYLRPPAAWTPVEHAARMARGASGMSVAGRGAMPWPSRPGVWTSWASTRLRSPSRRPGAGSKTGPAAAHRERVAGAGHLRHRSNVGQQLRALWQLPKGSPAAGSLPSHDLARGAHHRRVQRYLRDHQSAPPGVSTP